MRLMLRIENFRMLSDGGPTSFSVVGQRGFDIGRGPYLDWTLPDESLEISGRHCEIRPQDGAYFLYDVSRNGTFVNGSDTRVQSPYQLKSGDQLVIGPYIISVTLDGASPTEPEIVTQAASYGDLWNFDGEIAPPISPKELAPKRPSPISHGDWIDRPADMAQLSSAHAEPDHAIDWTGQSQSFQPVPPPPTGGSSGSRPIGAKAQPSASVDWGPIADMKTPSPPAPAPKRASNNDNPWTRERNEAHVVAEASSAQISRPAAAESQRPTQASAPATGEASSPHLANADSQGAYSEFLSALEKASGIPPALLAESGAAALGEEMGALLRLFVDETRQLLEARSAAKRMTRSMNQTVIQARNNNPLKFSPTSEEALRILFGPTRPGYLDAHRAFAQAFLDLKTHQLRTYAAMQQAVRMLAEDLDPREIDKSMDKDSGIAGLIGSRKARLWDAYVVRWEAKNRSADDKLVDAFMRYYAECYDRADGEK